MHKDISDKVQLESWMTWIFSSFFIHRVSLSSKMWTWLTFIINGFNSAVALTVMSGYGAFVFFFFWAIIPNVSQWHNFNAVSLILDFLFVWYVDLSNANISSRFELLVLNAGPLYDSPVLQITNSAFTRCSSCVNHTILSSNFQMFHKPLQFSLSHLMTSTLWKRFQRHFGAAQCRPTLLKPQA